MVKTGLSFLKTSGHLILLGILAMSPRYPLAQAATTATPQFDYILKECQETQQMGDPKAAWRGIDPGNMLAIALNRQTNKQIVFDLSSIKNISLLQGSRHGNLFAEVDNQGLTSYHYDPTPEYIGDDSATFLAEFEGKKYKIEVLIKVLIVIDINSSQCPDPKLIKVRRH